VKDYLGQAVRQLMLSDLNPSGNLLGLNF